MRNFGYEEDTTTVPLTDYHLWGRIFAFCKKHWLLLGLAVMLSFVVTGATLGLPYLLQHAIDNYITNDELARQLRFSGLTTVSTFFFALVITILLATFFQVVTLEWIGQSIMHRIRQDLFAHIITLDPPFFDRTPTGRLVTRLTNDIQNMHEMFTSILVTIFNDLLRIVGILIILFVFNVRLALVMSLFVPLALIFTRFFARLARTQFRSIRSQLAKMNSFLSETVSGISTLQVFGRQKESRAMFEKLSGGYLHRNLQQIKLFGTFMPLTEFMSSTAIALILWFGGREILRDQLSIGELVAFLSYMRLFFQPLRELAQKYSIVQSAMASAERIFQLFDHKSSLALTRQPVSTKNRAGNLRFTDVSFRYDGNTDILKKIDFSVESGQTVALVGTTGSGKTTIVNLLLRFYEPHTGTIQIDGIDIHRFHLQDLRQMVGVVLQDIFILQDTLLANIVMDTGTPRKRVEEILSQTGMQRFVDRLPDGLDTMIGEGGQQLSTGEKQLLSFTRVLCRDPAILILDEATAAIDTESENILEEAIDKSFIRRTSLVIAHRLSTIRRADTILVMEHGRITERGSHDTLMQLNGHYAELIAKDLSGGHMNAPYPIDQQYRSPE